MISVNKNGGRIAVKELSKLPIKVLYVEADANVRTRTVTRLRDYVENLLVAEDFEEGLKLFENATPDLVITDIDPPQGIELVRTVRARNPELPLFVTTGSGNILQLTEAIREGVSRYLDKHEATEKLPDSIRDCFKFSHHDFLTLRTDSKGRIVDLSDTLSRFLGYRHEELVGTHISGLVKPMHPSSTSLHEQMAKSGGSGHLSALFRRKGGGEVVLNGRMERIETSGGTLYETRWYPIECLLRSQREFARKLRRERYFKGMMRYHAIIAQEAVRAEKSERFVQRILEEASREVDPEISLCLLTEKGSRLVPHPVDAFDPPLKEGVELTPSHENGGCLPLTLALRHREVVLIDDLERLPDSPFREEMRKRGVVSLAAIPVDSGPAEPRSLLLLAFRRLHRFDREEMDLWRDVARTIGFGLSSIRLRRERDELIRKLDRLAYTDSLTGAVNRHRGVERIEHEIRRGQRYGTHFSLLFFDIDNFKKINDTHGHAVGDRVLAGVAKRIEKALRATDTLIRWGGEEFLILLPETKLADAVALARKLRKVLEERSEDLPLPITASFGVAEWNGEEDLDALIGRADARMYEAKREGRNRIAY